MITTAHDRLVFQFPEVHKDATMQINFQRTLRIPDDNREYGLPPGLDPFPLLHVDDYAERMPGAWNERGGVFLPMYQAEAMWLYFTGSRVYPFAVKVAAGKIDAVTGKQWDRKLHRSPQDYLAIPRQPWLDGFCVSKGSIRQFVAMSLGEGYTAEEQITGEAEHGGLQIIVYPMKRERYEELLKEREQTWDAQLTGSEDMMKCYCLGSAMGLAPGGLMRQEIYDDTYNLDDYDSSVSSRCYVHILNSLQYREVTGQNPPTKPPTAAQYTQAGLPWFDYYDAEAKALKGSKKLAGLDSVAAKWFKKWQKPLPENEPVSPTNVRVIRAGTRQVREGEF